MTAVALQERAVVVADDLVERFPGIQGVCLFGSVARGEAGPDSDLDLLVVGNDPELTPSQIRRRLRLGNAEPRVSIVYHTPETLSQYVRTGSRFLVHVQREGKVLYDASGQLADLQRRPPLKAPIRAEVEGQLKRLRLYKDPSRYNGNFLLPLSHVFAIGKAVIMAILTEHGVFEFDRGRAFKAFSACFPDSADDVQTLLLLEPFYAVASKGVSRELPFAYRDCEAELREAVAAVRRLAKNADYARARH